MKTKLLLLALGLATFAMTAQHDDYWTGQDTGFSQESRGASDISIVDENVVWVRAHDGNPDTNNNIQEYTMTSDGGATWTAGTINIGSPTSGIAMIHGISATTAWLVAFPHASGDDQGIFKTTDGGATWNKQETASYSDAASFANVVYFWDENNGFAQGDPVDGYYELYTTTDGGTNWTRVPSSDIPEPETGEYGFTSQIFVTGDAVWWTTNHGRIYRNYNKGVGAWEVFQSPISNFSSESVSGEISFNDNDNGYLTDNTGLFWTTTNGGETWNPIFPGGDGVVFPGNVAAIPGTNAVVVAGAGDLYGTAVSQDGGATFTTICDTEQHLDTRFINGTTGWSGSFYSSETGIGIYKYTGPEILSIADLHAKGFTSFPNPVKDIFKLGAKESITNVSVVNLLGQEVYASQPSSLTHDIDMSNLPHGTYIVNITIGDVAGSVKVVK